MADYSRDKDAENQIMMQRVAERRARVEQRLKAKREKEGGAHAGLQGGAMANKSEQQQLSKGEQQIQISRARLNTHKAEAYDAVSIFRLKADEKENERRQEEDELLQRLIHEARQHSRLTQATPSLQKQTDESCNIKKDSIEFGFEELCAATDKITARELSNKLTKQKEDCGKVIAVKDKLVDQFRSQLKDKDELYVKALKNQAIKIDELIQIMHSQTESTVAVYQKELVSIEEAFKQERRQLITTCDKEIADLVKQRDILQETNKNNRNSKMDADYKELDKEHDRMAEEYNKRKRTLQSSIHYLTQELRYLQAVWLLNAEKLDYNYKVLLQRTNENKDADKQHQKKVNKLLDMKTKLTARLSKADKEYEDINHQLTRQHLKITKQYRELQVKFQHFEKADKEKYQQVWSMHEDECMGMIHRCLQADRVIFENQLGVAWVPPSLDFWQAAGGSTSEMPLHQSTLGTEGAPRAEGTEDEADTNLVFNELVQEVLCTIYAQCTFLVDERVRQAIDTVQNEEELRELMIQSMLDSLSITTNTELKKLTERFIVENEDGSMAMVSQQQAYAIVKEFMDDRNRANSNGSALGGEATDLDLSALGSEGGLDGTHTGAGMSVGKLSAAAQKRKTLMTEKLQKKHNEQEFWRAMTRVIPDSHTRVWDALESGLDRYYIQLQKRSALIEETDSIRKQNDELRSLLNQYLGSKVNEELFSPPQLQVLPS